MNRIYLDYILDIKIFGNEIKNIYEQYQNVYKLLINYFEKKY